MARVTLKDVAAQAGVSYQTVSKVVNKQASVAPETEARIWETIHELGYRPNVAARNLRTQSSNLIGYGWRPLDDGGLRPLADGGLHPILSQFLYTAIQRAEADNYHMLAFLLEKDSAENTLLYRDLFARRQVEGFILADTNTDDPRIRFLIDKGIPFASFGQANDGWDFCWVDVNGRSGMRQIIKHLQERGHQKIALITWHEDSRAGKDRETGYFNQMAELNLPVADDWILRGNNTVSNGYQFMSQLLALPPSRRPTAVACVSDHVAIGAVTAAMGQGLVVGQDIAITGYDNVPMTEFLYPPLTTVQQPIQQAGECVIDLLLSQINGDPITEKGILLEPELVIRRSS